ncbi:MAG: class I SAM-dependent methyltransferase, partial [Acidimicrobiales bacterium]
MDPSATTPEVGDAFGRALVSWAAGHDDPETYERPDGYVETGPGPDGYLAPFRRWPVAERLAMAQARGRVVDVGCGAGRVALHLGR